MSDNKAKEYYLTLLDQAKALLNDDPLSEVSDVFAYKLEPKVTTVKPIMEKEVSIKDCHECDLFRSRRIYASPLLTKSPLILFIAPYSEGDRIFSPESQDYFYKWQKALHLESNEVALSTIIRCPTDSFDSEHANICKKYLRDEMVNLQPKNLVIFSEEASRYMTRCRDPWSSMCLGRTFNINHIPSYCSPSPADLVNNKVSKREVWDTLKAIAVKIGIGERLG